MNDFPKPDGFDPQALTQFLHRHLPSTQALQAQVRESSSRHAVVTGSLQANINPFGVVFGGSLQTFGLMAGWLVAFRALLEAGGARYPVVAASQCEFLRPAATDFVARAQATPAEIEQLMAGRRRAIEIQSELLCEDAVVAQYRARFAAVTPSANQACLQ